MRDFALETHLSSWEFKARHNLAASDAESMSLSELLAHASASDREAFEELWLGYTETRGLDELRSEIASTYERATADDVLCFAGAEEGLYAAMRVLLEAGDHAIVVVPNYQSAETLPLDRCEVSGVPLEPDAGWTLDVGRVKREIRPNTKLISINFPNNPTGAVLERARFDELIALCREKGIYLFSDEVYRLMERDPASRLPQVSDVYERGLSLNVMSKAYGLPGLRIGWIVTQDRQLSQRLERYKHYLSICNSAPSERLAVVALRARGTILGRTRALIAENAERLDSFFGEFAELFDWHRPAGGCIGFPRYRGPGTTEEFCERLLQRSGVLLLPPRVYRSDLLPTPRDRFRIGFGRRGVADGLAAFRAHLSGGRA